jgi:hypothetical protein
MIFTNESANEETSSCVGPLLRIGSSFVGLLAGNLALLVVSLGFWVRTRIALPPNRGPALGADIENALSMMLIYAIFSVFGWVLIGIPAVLAIPSRTILRLSWWVLVPTGVVLGPASLLLIFSLMGDLSRPRIFTEGRLFFLFAGVVSGVAFWVHCLLVRRQSV